MRCARFLTQNARYVEPPRFPRRLWSPRSPLCQYQSRQLTKGETQARRAGTNKALLKATKVPSERFPLSRELSEFINSDRIHIVSPKLCDDVLNYIGSSLDKHKGCDIIDICPGPGLWSSKLHDYLQPRNHILVEPERKRYARYLNPLLEQPGSTYKLADCDWEEFQDYDRIMNEYLKLDPLPPSDPARLEPNNSLLVTACVGHLRVKRGRAFSSIARQLLIWFAKSVVNYELFHTRGPVRILFWLADDEKSAILPRSLSNREKTSLTLDRIADIREIAGSGDEVRAKGKVVARDPEFELQSAETVAKRMQSSGTILSYERRPESHQLALELMNGDAATGDSVKAAARKASGGVTQAVADELEKLKALDKAGKIVKGTEDARRYSMLKAAVSSRQRTRKRLGPLLDIDAEIEQLDKMIAIGEEPAEKIAEAKEKLEKLIEEYHALIANFTDRLAEPALVRLRGERRGLSQDPPLLQWDRREFEPLVVYKDEFMVSKPMSLLDIQPRIVPGEEGGAEHEYYEDMLQPLFSSGPNAPLLKLLENISPGTSEYILAKCPSLKNPLKGGTSDLRSFKASHLTPEMIEEIAKAWKTSPWRPPNAGNPRFFRNKMMSLSGSI